MTELSGYAWLSVAALASTALPPTHAAPPAGSDTIAITRQYYAEQTSATSVGEGFQAAAGTATVETALSAPLLPSAHLWRIALLHGVALSDRVSALAELAERSDPSLADYLVKELAGAALHPAWRRALLTASEWAPLTASHNVQALCAELIRHTLELDRAGGVEARPALWAALRRIGSVADPESLPALLPLLRSTDMQTRQAALQAVTVIAGAKSSPIADEVARRAMELAHKHLDVDWLVSGPNIALAANAVRAAVATNGKPARDELAEVVRALGRPALERLCRDALAEA